MASLSLRRRKRRHRASRADLAAALQPPRPRGVRPAAGLLLRSVDCDGVYYLLGRRTRSLGGTWANFGGSLNPGEHPLAGALRELAEETAIRAADLVGSTIAAAIDCGTPDVPYTLFVIDAPRHVFDLEADLSWENDDVVWVREDVVGTLNLHRGFARAWEVIAP